MSDAIIAKVYGDTTADAITLLLTSMLSLNDVIETGHVAYTYTPSRAANATQHTVWKRVYLVYMHKNVIYCCTKKFLKILLRFLRSTDFYKH